MVEKLDGVDEAVAELRKRENAASSRASRQSKLATWDRLLTKFGYSGTCLSLDFLRGLRASCSLQGTEAPTVTSDWLQQGTTSSTDPVS